MWSGGPSGGGQLATALTSALHSCSFVSSLGRSPSIPGSLSGQSRGLVGISGSEAGDPVARAPTLVHGGLGTHLLQALTVSEDVIAERKLWGLGSCHGRAPGGQAGSWEGRVEVLQAMGLLPGESPGAARCPRQGRGQSRGAVALHQMP